ncbi:MAG: hypothetical protein AAF092_09655 [Pseudomonadota bacterium]
MSSRLAGALTRALLVVLFVMTPGLMLPSHGERMSDVVALIALSAAAITFLEYMSEYPSVVEFRDAPPYNRLRFGAAFLTLAALTLMLRGDYQPTLISELFAALGGAIGRLFDLPFSPVRNILLALPPDMSTQAVHDIRTLAAISYLGSLISIAVFFALSRGGSWPGRELAFNVWVNLPTFDPTAGGDVVHRLQRDARVYLLLGVLLPFVIPAGISVLTGAGTPLALEAPQALVWTLILWAFLPSSLVMRGIALGRVAHMIDDARRRRYAEFGEDEALA